MKTRIIIHAFIFFILALSFSCEKPERNNPWDEKANLSTEAWTPQNLQIEDVSITEKKLTWTYDDKSIEGFKLDRKKGDEAWQEAYQTFAKETRDWNDTEVIPDPDLTYSYRIYAYAGKSSSSLQSVSSSGEIAAPTNLQTEKLTEKTYKLTWMDNSTGEQGFKVDRKIEEGEWIKAYKTVVENQNSFTDTNVFRATNIEYRVYAFFESYESSKTTINTNAELTAPTDLQFTNNSISSVTLMWQDNSTGEDGFKIDRKTGSENWEIAYANVSENIKEFTDNDFIFNEFIHYRVYAFVNDYNSSYAENSFNATIPPPEDFEITANSITSVTLNWQYNNIGEEGFKIDRKINEGNWELEFASLNSNQTTFTDGGVALENNDYTYRVYAFVQNYNSQKIEEIIDFICGISLKDSRDGNQYETVKIGEQCWMKENLAYLPIVSPSSNGSETSPYYYVYDYQGTNVTEAKATSNYQTYGVLYNWPASLNACPQDWHLPEDDEWSILTDYLGGENIAGGKMKETGTMHWNSPNIGATNSSGFTGLAGGFRNQRQAFDYLGRYVYFWSLTEYLTSSAWNLGLFNGNGIASSCYGTKKYGYSLRCVRD